jgi:hypothetical protein
MYLLMLGHIITEGDPKVFVKLREVKSDVIKINYGCFLFAKAKVITLFQFLGIKIYL